MLISSSLYATQNTRSENETAKVIIRSIHLLKNGKEKEFLQNLLNPEELKKAKVIIDEKFIARFKNKKMKSLLKVFNEANNLTPSYSSEAAVAYKLANGNYLSFQKIKGKWYLSNSTKNPESNPAKK